MNVVLVRGKLARDATVRVLPSGDLLAQLSITVPVDDGPAESVPVAWFQPKGALPEMGEEVVVLGRVRRRFFRAGGGLASSTEVVATDVARARQKQKVRALVARAGALLGDPSPPRAP